MTEKTANAQSVVDVVRSLLRQFSDQLSGPRQATRNQLIQYLACELEIADEDADKLFDDLRAAGVIDRGDKPGEEFAVPDRDQQAWSIDVENSAAKKIGYPSHGTLPVDPDSQSVDLLRRAIANRATDIHLDPYGDEIEVRFRIDGQLEHYCRLEESIGEQIASQLKVLAGLNNTERFHAQEGRLSVPTSLSLYDIRIMVTPVVNGESMALRLMRRDQIIRPVDSLGMSPDDLATLRDRISVVEGIVMAGGPTGSGKTTTLYSLIHHLDDGRRNVVTIEDPVEYFVPGFSQIQIDRKHDVTLANGLKTALRMDPDILLLGEIRDAKTAEATMRAASSGKCVFTTFHTRDAASVVTASRDLRIDDRSLASNLRRMVCGRYVRE